MTIFSILFILISNAVTLRRDLSILFNRVAILGLIFCIMQNFSSLFTLSKGIGLHGGLIYSSDITQVFQLFLFLMTILILQLTSFYPLFNLTTVKAKFQVESLSNAVSYVENLMKKLNFLMLNKGEQFKIIEYPLLLLFIIMGASLLISTNDLISIFLSIELQSYGLYLISTIFRNSELATTGGLMYFLLGGLSSCFILLGTSLLYTNSGNSSLDGIYVINNISDSDLGVWYKPYYINFSLLIFSVGFLFKLSAAPFHFWSPEVYDAIPTIVTVFAAIVPKIAIFILLLQLVHFTKNNFFMLSWTFSLVISSFLSLIVGTVVGLAQFRVKRLLAYSTISHVGFILLALAISSIESIQAFLFYLIQYSISNLNIFVILITIGFSLYWYKTKNLEHNKLTEKDNSPIQLVDQLKGYFYINPFLSISLAITIFSFIGIPPLIGFFAKQMVLSAALDQGWVFLVLIAITTSVISAVYYLNIIKEIFFYSPEYIEKNVIVKKVNIELSNVIIASPISLTISIVTLIILLFIFINKEWLSMGTILVQRIFDS